MSNVLRHHTSRSTRWLVDVDADWKRFGLGVELFVDTRGGGSYATLQIILPFCLVTISRIDNA